MLVQLADPEVYRLPAERVRSRQRRNAEHAPLVPGGPPLAAMGAELEGFLRRLAREVTTRYYAFSPVVPHRARIGGKERVLYRAPPLDDIVLGALADVLSRLIDPSLSPRVFSYRRGRSVAQALQGLRGYLRAHTAQRPDPRTRGLYVIRRDIERYGDAIPCHTGSRLWSQLTAALAQAGVEASEPLSLWLRAAFRPPLRRGALLEEPLVGIPTGSPLQPLACNLYLTPLDRMCESIPEAFYARFGDDILFVHPSASETLRVRERIDACIAELGLAPQAKKSGAYYFTQPGHAPRDPQFRGVSSLDYLGVRVDFRGSFGLTREKQRRLLDDLRARLRRSRGLLTGVDAEQRAATLAAIVCGALEPSGRLANASAEQLCKLVDDRAQLRQLDYQLARMLSASLTGEDSPRALRRYPPRRLRREAGLCSLVALRNRGRRVGA